jgi:FkbM family methyltransferase
LIGTNNAIVEKVLKLFFYFSVVSYRRAAPRAGARSQRVVIHNFDSDLHLNVDRGRAMGAAIYWTGFHEFKEFLFLDRYLKPEMTFIDVGANLGEYSLFAAKRLTQGRVLAFEPLPSMQAVLRENIALNKLRNIDVFPFGLSSQAEMLTIHEFEDAHEGLATFYPGQRGSRPSVDVPLRTLDEVVVSLQLDRVDFIKIDIEGGELKALQGCRSVIEKFPSRFSCGDKRGDLQRSRLHGQ